MVVEKKDIDLFEIIYKLYNFNLVGVYYGA